MFDPLKRKTQVVAYSTLAFLLGIGLASGMGWTDSGFAALSLSRGPDIDERVIQPALDLSNAFAEIAEAVTPGVVRIEVRRTMPVVQAPAFPGPIPPGLRDWLDPPGEGRGGQEGEGRGRGPSQPEQPGQESSGGSGFLVSDDGYILTNDHVVNGAEEIMVYLNDGRAVQATLIGTDPFTDVATIKIEADDLTALSTGSSDDVRVGEWIMAVGNPGFGGGRRGTTLDYSVTAGIVSALGRPLQIIQDGLYAQGDENFRWAIEDFIQTDAVVNPGNSGGPLVDLRGDVIGINSAIASSTGYFQGYSFAIPIDLARRVMEDLVEYGQVRRPRMGVEIRAVTDVMADAFDLPTVSGVWIAAVQEDGPSFGRLQMDDIIIAVDGEPIGRVGQLQGEIAKRRPGDQVTIDVWRDGRRENVTITLDEAPLNAVPTTEVTAVADDAPESRLGLGVSLLTDDLRIQFGIEGTEAGVVVTDVRRDSPADRAGLAPGHRILSISGVPVTATEDVGRILEREQDGAAIRIRVMDPGGNEVTLFTRLRG